MNSITYGIGYCLAILVVNVFSTDYTLFSEPKVTLNGPFNFGYKTSNSFLHMKITLKNISPSVTAVYLKYINNRYDAYQNKYWGQPELQGVEVNIEKKTSEIKFMILKYLIYNHIAIDVELYSQQGICDTTNIVEGRDATTLTKKWAYNHYVYQDQHGLKYYDMTENCLAPKPCEIVVDLKNKCPEHYFNCNIEASQYICTFTKVGEPLTHRFYQTYGNNSYIGPAPEMEAKTTKLFIKLELFDNNTSVNVADTYALRNKQIIWSNKINISAKDIFSENNNVQKLVYSETTDVQYSCENYIPYSKHLHVGFIDTTDNKIKTINKTKIKRKFKMAENGTILCCLYYTSSWTGNGNEMNITRLVDNKTLLIYQSQESTNITGIQEQTLTSQTDWLLWYLVPSLLGICVLMLSLYIIITKKNCCTNSQPAEETVELDNHATQNQVLYANLDLVRGGNQAQGQQEEPHYANIIGVLHPL